MTTTNRTCSFCKLANHTINECRSPELRAIYEDIKHIYIRDQSFDNYVFGNSPSNNVRNMRDDYVKHNFTGKVKRKYRINKLRGIGVHYLHLNASALQSVILEELWNHFISQPLLQTIVDSTAQALRYINRLHDRFREVNEIDETLQELFPAFPTVVDNVDVNNVNDNGNDGINDNDDDVVTWVLDPTTTNVPSTVHYDTIQVRPMVRPIRINPFESRFDRLGRIQRLQTQQKCKVNVLYTHKEVEEVKVADEDDVCAICLNQLTNDSVSLSCSHQFCCKCIVQSLRFHNKRQHNPTCALCRTEIKNICANTYDGAKHISDELYNCVSVSACLVSV
jgi:hypothetical protein